MKKQSTYGNSSYISKRGHILTAPQRKFLKHFTRIAGIGASIFNEMEETALAFIAIGKKRTDAKTSEEIYAKVAAALSALDTLETDTFKKLYSLLGVSQKENGEEPDDSGDCDNDEDASILEQIGQGVVDFLGGIADKLDDFAGRL